MKGLLKEKPFFLIKLAMHEQSRLDMLVQNSIVGWSGRLDGACETGMSLLGVSLCAEGRASRLQGILYLALLVKRCLL